VNCVSTQVGNELVAAVDGVLELRNGELKDLTRISGPVVKVFGQRGNLLQPGLVTVANSVGPHHQKIYVTVDLGVTACGGSEHPGGVRRHHPSRRFGPHPGQELMTQVGQREDRWCGEVVPVECVQVRPADVLAEHDTIVDQIIKGHLDCAQTGMRLGQGGNSASSQRLLGVCEHDEDPAARPWT